MKPSFEILAQQYRSALLDGVIPFWEKHSIDREQGGFFTCLSREGRVFDTDKFVWLQARQVWTFAMLFERMEARQNWLEIARHGADFLARHGRDAHGRWYFSLARAGQPLTQPHSIYSDCFAAMAFGQLAKVAADANARTIAAQTFAGILGRRDQPKGSFGKTIVGARPMVSLAVPMIVANLTMELQWLLEPTVFAATLDRCVDEIFRLFLDLETGILRENASPDGRKLDCFEGRLVNPGHGIEAMWFLMDIAQQRSDAALANRAVEVALRTLEFGWDRDFGGIFYFRDALGHPLQQLEWDQKLWWVHVETLVALLKGYRLTGNQACADWFERVHTYVWSHFPDPEFGEWFGYLNRRGEVLLNLKGGKWKGCFHVPRGLLLCLRECEWLAQHGPALRAG